jgi:hypothetical protein
LAYEAKVSGDQDAAVVTAQQADLEGSQAITVVSDLVLHAVTEVFDALGASSARRGLGLDRYWRNARTIASHNPRIYHQRSIGNTTVSCRGSIGGVRQADARSYTTKHEGRHAPVTALEEITSLTGFSDASIFDLTAAELPRRVATACDTDPAGAESLIATYRADRSLASPSGLYAAIASDRRFDFGSIFQAERQAAQAPVFAYWLPVAEPGAGRADGRAA